MLSWPSKYGIGSLGHWLDEKLGEGLDSGWKRMKVLRTNGRKTMVKSCELWETSASTTTVRLRLDHWKMALYPTQEQKHPGCLCSFASKDDRSQSLPVSLPTRVVFIGILTSLKWVWVSQLRLDVNVDFSLADKALVASGLLSLDFSQPTQDLRYNLPKWWPHPVMTASAQRPVEYWFQDENNCRQLGSCQSPEPKTFSTPYLWQNLHSNQPVGN